ncbi:MAG: hypothetical protein PUA83_06280 [Clostridiales bacterium]|nr:hypothetical protein [Clostridiales bacterium]
MIYDPRLIEAPSAANVGQTIVVSAVDDTGAPTAWEPADLPTGGGESETWRLVQDITLDTDDVGTFGYCDGADIVANGSLDWTLAAAGAAMGIAGIIAAYLKYTKKDIR